MDDRASHRDQHNTAPIPVGAELPSLRESDTSGPSSRQYRIMEIIAVGIVSAMSGICYFLWQNLHYPGRALLFALVCGGSTFLLCRNVIKPFEERSSGPDLSAIAVRDNHNYLSNLQRHSYLFDNDDTSGKDEDVVDYAERPPLIEGIIDQGLPLPIFLIGCWIGLQFPGGNALVLSISSGNPGVLLPVLIVVALTGTWVAWAILEYPVRSDRQEKVTQNERSKARRIIVRVLAGFSLAVVVLLWWYLHWPLVGWLTGTLRDNPYLIGWLIAVPAAIWSESRVEYYLGSYIIVTNLYLRIGSTGYIVAGNHRLSLNRAEATNSRMGQGRLARLLGHYEVMRDTPSERDTAFARIRVKHGPEMAKALGG